MIASLRAALARGTVTLALLSAVLACAEREPATGLAPGEVALKKSPSDVDEGVDPELPPREQELVALKYGAEATNRAIAELTGLSESNVGTILHRVVQALRRDW